MAASGFTPIQLFRTTTASATPTAMSLADGELAINLTDEKLYFKNAAGVVKLLASNSGSAGSVTSVDVSGGTTGLTTSGGPITSSGTVTLAGTLNVANGGTGVTTSTGTGSVVLSNSPTLVTPTLGAASATSIANGLGAVGTPSYTFTGDTNTGMWSPSSDAIAFSTAGSERVRVDSSGNVGIGTASPTFLLHVNGTGYFNSSVQFFPQDGFRFTSVSAVSAMRFGSAFTGEGTAEWAYNRATGATTLSQGSTGSALNERMRIDSSGNVGIGTSSPGAALDIGGEGFFQISSSGTSRAKFFADASLTYLTSEGARPLTLSTNSAERMRIDSSGNVGIGLTNPSVRMEIVGASGFNPATQNTYAMWIANSGSANGDLAFGSSTTAAHIQSFNAKPLILNSAGNNVGIGTSSPNAAALLDVTSTTAGFLPPRMTTAQRDAIGSPPNGLMLYNTTTDKLQVRAGGAWVDLH